MYLEQSLREGVTTIRDEGMLSDYKIKNYVKRKQEISELDKYPTIIGVGKFFRQKVVMVESHQLVLKIFKS